MAYTTGSGTWANLLSAIVTHAVADGWTESNGIGTGFPIEKNARTYVDFGLATINNDGDWTTGVNAGISPRQVASVCIGTSAANATSNASADSTSMAAYNDGWDDMVRAQKGSVIANVDRALTNYWIMSDSASGVDYIHVVFQFSNGVHPDCYQMFSFGELDKGGLTHGGISYTTSRYARGYAAAIGSGINNHDWGTITQGFFPFAGDGGKTDWGDTSTRYLIHTPTPVNSVNGYPAAGVVHGPSLMWDSSRSGTGTGTGYLDSGNNDWRVTWQSHRALQMPYSGAVSLQAYYMILLNGLTNSNFATFVGEFPGVRACNMTNYNPGDEISYGGETWKLFPWLRNTPDSELGGSYAITSGRFGCAFKKVV